MLICKICNKRPRIIQKKYVRGQSKACKQCFRMAIQVLVDNLKFTPSGGNNALHRSDA